MSSAHTNVMLSGDSERPQSASLGTDAGEHPLQQLRFDVLDANSQGIYLTQCQDYDEAERVLVDVYNRITESEKDLRRQREGHATSSEQLASAAPPPVDTADADVSQQLIDQLKATTLNNISFVVYHKGLFRQAIAHLEAAQELEGRWGIQSGVSAVNACVLYNAVGQYAVASQYALQGIDILRRDAAAAAATGQGSDERSKLWGAAWHNLAVAQLQLADPTSPLENSNVLFMFENSMQACQELLGKQHPMTRAVTETYRLMRSELISRGAFKSRTQNKTASSTGVPTLHTYNSDAQPASRKSAYTGRRLGPASQRGSERREHKQLSVLLVSQDHARYVEKIEAEPFVKSTSGRRANTASSNEGRLIVLPGSGVLTAPDPAEAALNSKIIARRLMQGLPSGPDVGANKYTPSSSSGRVSNSLQQFRRRSLTSAAVASPEGKGAYLHKHGLQGVSLRGNLALAGSLYANPHPLTNSPRKPTTAGSSTPRGGGGYVPLPPTSAHGSMRGPSTRSGNYPPSSAFPPSTGKSSVRLPRLVPHHLGEPVNASSGSQPPMRRAFDTPPSTSYPGGDSNDAPFAPRPPASSPPHTSPRHELLMGDMWVEAPVNAPSPHGSSYSSFDVRAGGNYNAADGGGTAYQQQLYAIDDEDRVVDPTRYAHPVS